jgi:hypothetical protein
MYDPFLRRRFQFRLPTDFGYSHTGLDPAGHLAFWETVSPKYGHSLWYLDSINASGGVVKPLVGAWDNTAAEQRGHFHPQLTYDRQWLLMTGADSTGRAQIAFLNVSDLTIQDVSRGIDSSLLSDRGEFDVEVAATISGVPVGYENVVELNADQRGEVEEYLQGLPQIE